MVQFMPLVVVTNNILFVVTLPVDKHSHTLALYSKETKQVLLEHILPQYVDPFSVMVHHNCVLRLATSQEQP